MPRLGKTISIFCSNSSRTSARMNKSPQCLSSYRTSQPTRSCRSIMTKIENNSTTIPKHSQIYQLTIYSYCNLFCNWTAPKTPEKPYAYYWPAQARPTSPNWPHKNYRHSTTRCNSSAHKAMSSTSMCRVVPTTAWVTGQALIANRNQIHTSTATHATPTTRTVRGVTVPCAVCGASEYWWRACLIFI